MGRGKGEGEVGGEEGQEGEVERGGYLGPVQAPAAIDYAQEKGLVKSGDVIVVVRGSVELNNTSGGSNLIHVMKI